MDPFSKQLLGVKFEENEYANKLVMSSLGEDVFEREGGQQATEKTPQDLGAAATKPEKVILNSFKDLSGVRDQFTKKNTEKTGPESAPQNLGAAATGKNEKRIPYPIHSELGRLNEGLIDSTRRKNQLIKDNGPKAGIEHYKKQISIYEQGIREAEEAKARFLKSAEKPSPKKIEIKTILSTTDTPKAQGEAVSVPPTVTQEISEGKVSKITDEEENIPFMDLVKGRDGVYDMKKRTSETGKQEILAEQSGKTIPDENYIRYVNNAPEMEGMGGEFKKFTLKDLAETKDSDIPTIVDLDDGEIGSLLEDVPVNKRESIPLSQDSVPAPTEDASKGWYGKAEDLEMHKFEQALEKFEDNTEKKIEGMGSWVLEKARSTGEWYKKQPLKYKLLLSASLFAAASAPAVLAGATIGTIVTAAFVGSLGQRALGGLATFVATEAWLKKSAEKGGRERTKAEATRHTIEAAVLGMLVGSGYAAEGLKNISDATGLTTLITDAYHFWLPPEDVTKIMEAVKAPFSETPTALPPEVTAVTGVAETATEKVLERGLTADFSVELGKNGVPESLERVFHMMAANHMDLKDVAMFGEAEGAKSLNIAANLVKLAEGHNLADVDNILGVSATDFNNAVTWDQAKNLLTIKDHGLFNKITGSLESRADTLWDQGVLPKGATAYLNDIKPETWTEILHADSLDKIGEIETGITGHDSILPEQIADFDNSEMVKASDEAQRKITERLDTLRNEINANPEPIKGTTYTVTGVDKNTSSGDWVNTKEIPITKGVGVMENIPPVKVPVKEALESLTNYNVTKIMNHDIDGLFGSKGFFGFGAKNGLNSTEWLNAKGLPTSKASGALKDYIENLKVHTGATPRANETTESYIKRAIAYFIKDDELVKTQVARAIPIETLPPVPEASILSSAPVPANEIPSASIINGAPLPKAPLIPEANIVSTPTNEIPSVAIRNTPSIPYAPLPQGSDDVIRFP